MSASRIPFSFSRDLEFGTEPELSKRMGCPRDLWQGAILKKLIDNSLDSAEEAGVEPEIAVEVDDRTVTVTDNGPGLAPELVAQLCVRSERTSTREAFAAPDRGAQGNALQVLMALPLGFGCDEAVTTIKSCGVTHQITLRVNRLEQRIDVDHVERALPPTPGTTISVAAPPVPALLTQTPNARLRMAYSAINDHAWLNPHATFKLNGDFTWSATTAVAKWTAREAIPAHWYTAERFGHRVVLEIKRNPKITVAQFVGGFRGLSSNPKRAQVAAAAGLSYEPLTALLNGSGTSLDPERTAALLAAMQDASRAPKPDALGVVGKETFEQWALNHASAAKTDGWFLTYDTFDCVVGSVPTRWEIGFTHLPGLEKRQVLAGQNFSPVIMPERMAVEITDLAGEFFGSDQEILLFLHRITPARQTLDYGKTRLALASGEARHVGATLARIAKPWVKYAKALAGGRKPPLSKPAKSWNFTSAAFAEMAEAYVAASSDGAYPVLSQQVFYAARPGILAKLDREELKPEERSRFCYTLLSRFMQENPALTAGWRVLYKPRGELIEPHTNRRVGLGTAEVGVYRAGWTDGAEVGAFGIEPPNWEVQTSGPCHRFGGVLVVEKGGIADLLRALEVDVKHDLAIVGNEGQNVEAELKLVDAFGPTAAKIFVLTDFDRQGFTIAENLRAGTWRYRHTSGVEVVHIGLRLDQIIDFGGLASERKDDDPGGLEDEPIGEKTLNHIGDDRLRACGATEDEIEILEKRRVELNALSTEALVELVEAALIERGIDKVVPDGADLVAAWRSLRAHAEIDEAIKKANKRAARRWAEAEAPDDLADQVRDLLEEQPTASWDEALRRIAGEAP